MACDKGLKGIVHLIRKIQDLTVHASTEVSKSCIPALCHTVLKLSGSNSKKSIACPENVLLSPALPSVCCS